MAFGDGWPQIATLTLCSLLYGMVSWTLLFPTDLIDAGGWTLLNTTPLWNHSRVTVMLFAPKRSSLVTFGIIAAVVYQVQRIICNNYCTHMIIG